MKRPCPWNYAQIVSIAVMNDWLKAVSPTLAPSGANTCCKHGYLVTLWKVADTKVELCNTVHWIVKNIDFL